MKPGIYATLLGGITFLASCTKSFKDINVDKNSVAIIGPAELPFLFSAAEHAAPSTYYDYQIAQNLFADQYAQYFACENPSFESDKYVMVSNWVVANFNPKYSNVMPQLQSIFAATDSATSAENAMAQIWWVWTFHRVTDYWGPIPYFNAGKSGKTVAYDPQDKIYDDFFKRLTGAVAVLKTHAGENHYGTYDLVYGGDVNRWIKFGNSMRLRLALRISKVDPARAKTEAEAAVASGVMEVSHAITDPTAMTDGDDAFVLRSAVGTDGNGLQAMSDWNEFRMSSTMASVLNGYSDPRRSEYFLPAVKTGKYSGLRNGIPTTEMTLTLNKAEYNSHVGKRWSSSNVVDSNGAVTGSATSIATGQNIMVTAESWFNRAEGVLLGWNVGGGKSAQQCYEEGIKQSLIQWNVTNATVQTNYINSTAKPIKPGDFYNSDSVSHVPIKWDPVDQGMQLQQIATQKWLALYPDGIEAWADYRRGHYMKMYPIIQSKNPDLTDPSTQWIRRITFLTSEKETNKAAVDAAAGLLGSGGDKITTPLWWDKN